MFGSLVLLPRILDLRSSEELVARARVGFVSGGSSQSGSLERTVAPGSGPESCLSWLERASFARAVWVFLRSIENFLARARVSVSGRSSDEGFARTSVFYISGQ